MFLSEVEIKDVSFTKGILELSVCREIRPNICGASNAAVPSSLGVILVLVFINLSQFRETANATETRERAKATCASAPSCIQHRAQAPAIGNAQQQSLPTFQLSAQHVRAHLQYQFGSRNPGCTFREQPALAVQKGRIKHGAGASRQTPARAQPWLNVAEGKPRADLFPA